MKKLSISVMAHPSREKFFPYLNERLGEPPFSIDTGFGIWENCKRAWRLRDKEASWHVVIQDDAIVCDDFLLRAMAVIEQAENNKCGAISFFFGNRKMLKSTAKRGMLEGFVESSWLHWGVAVCLRADLVDPMIAYGDTINIKQDDTRISLFLKKKGQKVYYPLPSLVDHRDEESLVGDAKGRQAYAFIDKP